MITKQDLIKQCKEENPTLTATINDVKIDLTDAEYEKACNDWAEMRLLQLKEIAAQEAKEKALADEAVVNANAKSALLTKLGITAEEAVLLLS